MSWFTGSPSKSDSSNQAYGYLKGALSPEVSSGVGASSGLAALLGVGGDPAAQQKAFQNWQNSTGYQFGLNQGSQAITNNNAAKGLLNSGSTLKSLDQFGQNYANTQYNNYFSQMAGLAGLGNQAASTIGAAGQRSSSTGQDNGIGGGLLSSMASNPGAAGNIMSNIGTFLPFLGL